MKNKIISWIKEQLKQANAKGIIIGLSGGVDSSVVAALSRQAIGPRRVLGLILPCHSQKQDFEDAKSIARKLGIKARAVDLTQVCDSLIRILPKGNSLARANLKPRLRMLVLYYFANKLNYLVCGTGNRSEINVGYFTKYGDGAADILPIGGLFKREVRELARELEIPKYIIDKPPTAGLWPGQTDEGEMGVTYPELDDILGRIEKRKKQVSPREKVNRIKRLMKRSQHKRQMPRICYL